MFTPAAIRVDIKFVIKRFSNRAPFLFLRATVAVQSHYIWDTFEIKTSSVNPKSPVHFYIVSCRIKWTRLLGYTVLKISAVSRYHGNYSWCHIVVARIIRYQGMLENRLRYTQHREFPSLQMQTRLFR